MKKKVEQKNVIGNLLLPSPLFRLAVPKHPLFFNPPVVELLVFKLDSFSLPSMIVNNLQLLFFNEERRIAIISDGIPRPKITIALNHSNNNNNNKSD